MSARRARRTRVLLDLSNRHQNSERPLVVVKIGGSLLTRPGLIGRTLWLLNQRPDARCLIICGGGQAANIVRDWQQRHGLTDEVAHRLAFRAMSFNEALLHSALPQGIIVRDVDEMVAAWEQAERPILACEQFVRANEVEADDPLPHNWNVTSDAIAAWCARQIGADELILAKSAELPSDMRVDEAVRRGLVDTHFPNVLSDCSVSWTNLRAEEPTVARWL